MLIGPPGSGKSYTGMLLAERLGYIEVDTGELIKHAIFDPQNQGDAEITRQKEIYLSGKLNTDTWVAKLVQGETERVAKEGKGIIFSGSPRRVAEAHVLIPLLTKLYGKGNVYCLLFTLELDEALKRIRARRVCDRCGRSIMPDDLSPACSRCGGRVIQKGLDDPSKIKTRFDEYNERTTPILDIMRREGILHEVSTMPGPEEIIRSILSIITHETKNSTTN